MLIPPILAVLLPLIASPVAEYVAKNKLPQWAKATIALAITVIAAISWAIFAGSLTNNLIDNVILVVGYIGVLAANPLKPLYHLASTNDAEKPAEPVIEIVDK